MQYKIFMLSARKMICLIFTFKIFAIDFGKLSPRTAPHNSNVGMLVDFRGAYRDFDITMIEVFSQLV